MSQPVPPPLPPPVPLHVQPLTYSAASKGQRPGVITSLGVIAIVVACLSGLASFLTCVYGGLFFSFMPMWAAMGSARGSAGGPNTSSVRMNVAADELSAGEVSVAVNSLRSVLDLDGKRTRELDNLLRGHGREVLGKPDDGTGNGFITDAWLRESILSSHSASGVQASAWFQNDQGRVDVFPDRAVFTSTNGSRTIETSAVNHSESETATAVSSSFRATPASPGASGGGTTLSKSEVQRVLKAVKGSALRPLATSQLQTIEQQISAPGQGLVTPGAARPVLAVTQTSQSVVVQFDTGMLNLGPQGQIRSSFSTASLAAKVNVVRPPLGLMIAESALSLGLAVYLLVVGIMVCRSSFKSPRLLGIYALLKIPLALVAAGAMLWLAHRAAMLTSGMTGVAPPAVMNGRTMVFVATSFVLSIAFPVAVLVCLRSRTVRAFFSSVSN